MVYYTLTLALRGPNILGPSECDVACYVRIYSDLHVHLTAAQLSIKSHEIDALHEQNSMAILSSMNEL